MRRPWKGHRVVLMLRTRSRSSAPRDGRRIALGLAGLLLAAPAAAGITGVCPDGSVFIVQEESAIPCRDGKRLEPHEVPPLRPEYLPRPYNWQVYNEGQNPNNPYNLIDSARQVRALRGGNSALGAGAGEGEGAAAGGGGAQAAPAAAPTRPALQPHDLGLSDGELRDLFLIVEYSQQDSPAEFVKQTAAGDESLRVQLAYSAAFETRMQEMWSGAGARIASRVLLFTAVASRADAFYATLTFTQGHLQFHPDANDAQQLGVLQGRLGPLQAQEVVLGYVVLPDRMDLSQPIGVYWDDRHTEVTFRR